MKKESLSLRDAFAKGAQLPFAMVRSLSGVTLGRNPVDVLEEELIEARFFDECQEIRIFHRENRLCAALLQSQEGDLAYRETYKLRNSHLFGAKLTISCELETDEDGQVFVADTRLIGWEEGKQND